MPITILIDDDTPILVKLIDLKTSRGERDVAISARDLAAKSSEAVNEAMATIVVLAKRVVRTIKAVPLSERPHNVEIEFSLALTTDANAFLVSAGTETHFKVTLKWDRNSRDKLDDD